MNRRTADRTWVRAVACCAALALAGCSGGSVSVRSSFSGAGGPPPLTGASSPAPPASAPLGLKAHYSGSGNLGLALLGIVILADFVQWTSAMFRPSSGAEVLIDARHPDQARIVSTPKKCVYPVPEMCRPTLIPERQVDTDVAAARGVEHVTSGINVLHGHSVGFE